MVTRKSTKKSATKTSAKKSVTKKTATKKTASNGESKTAGKAASKTEPRFKVGDRVRWDSSGGESIGHIVKVATTGGKIKDFEYTASKDDPRYIVETDEGKHAAHKAGELKKM